MGVPQPAQRKHGEFRLWFAASAFGHLLSVGRPNKLTGLKSRKCFSHRLGGWKSKNQVPAQCVPGELSAFFLRSHVTERERSGHQEDRTPMTSSNPNPL